ncbi:MAG TPA: DUF2782 domain-containing protein [Noviherbaspirillum sp.]
MRTLKACHIAVVCVAAYAMPLLAAAQQPADAPPPPKMEKLEEGEAPAVNIRPGQERKITEKRAPGGKVTETKVTTGKSTYYLKPNETPGTVPGDVQSSVNRGAQWEVGEFDFGRGEAKETPAAQSPAVAAPPPAPAKK